MDIIRIKEPTTEAVSLKDVKDYLRVEHDDEDNQITTMMYAATALIEKYLNRGLITQTWQIVVSRYPLCNNIKLLYGPIQSITSVTSNLSDGTQSIMPNTDYILTGKDQSPRVTLGYSKVWPTATLQPRDGVVIEYITGFGDVADDVPVNIRQGLLATIASMYEDRETGSELSGSVKGLISNQKVYTF